jgi:putative transposase
MKQARDPLYLRHRFPTEVVSYSVGFYFRFLPSLRMVEEMFAARVVRDPGVARDFPFGVR